MILVSLMPWLFLIQQGAQWHQAPVQYSQPPASTQQDQVLWTKTQSFVSTLCLIFTPVLVHVTVAHVVSVWVWRLLTYMFRMYWIVWCTVSVYYIHGHVVLFVGNLCVRPKRFIHLVPCNNWYVTIYSFCACEPNYDLSTWVWWILREDNWLLFREQTHTCSYEAWLVNYSS